MIILDKILEQRHADNNPIKVAMVGAGFMGRGVALQIVNYTLGMDLVAISNRNMGSARRAYQEAGIEEITTVESLEQLEESIKHKKPAITDNASLLCQAEEIDAIFEVTGSIEFAASIALEAIKKHKHFISMNAELDGTIGPLLKTYV